MKFSISVENVSSFISPEGTNILFKTINEYRFQKILINYYWVYNKLTKESKELTIESGFKRYFDALAKSGIQTLKEAINNPYAAVWLIITKELIFRKSHLNFPELHISQHLEMFPALIAMALGKSKSRILNFPIWSDEQGFFFLSNKGKFISHKPFPFQKLWIELKNKKPLFYKNNKKLKLIECDFNPVITISNIEINSDENLKSYLGKDFILEKLNNDSIIKWKDSVEKALKIIGETNNLLLDEILNCIKIIVPVCSEHPDVHASASFKELPGLIALSWTSDIAILSEAIVHEYHHLKLYNLQNVCDILIDNEGLQKYYSPWRKDPRPLSGLLHGVYVFQAVLEFWCKFFKSRMHILHEERLKQRVYLISKQVKQGIEALNKYAVFSNIGKKFFEEMIKNVNKQLQYIPKLDSNVKKQLEFSISNHKKQWRIDNYKLIDLKSESINIKSENSEKFILNLLNIQESGNIYSLKTADKNIINYFISQSFRGNLEKAYTNMKVNASSNTLLKNLINGHYFYISGKYSLAALSYSKCIFLNKTYSDFWRYFGFSLRHLEKYEDSEFILTNIDSLKLVSNSIKTNPESVNIDKFIQVLKKRIIQLDNE